MKKKINLFGLLLFLAFAGLNAQTPYFYYYGGEKQYFELNTSYAFVSVADDNTANRAFATYNATYEPFRIDIPEGKQSKTYTKRVWTLLSFEEKFSDEAYLSKLYEIKHLGKDVIVAPCFKTQYQDKIGLSNFFYVKLNSLSDTILLKQEAEKEHAVIAYRSSVHLWFVLSVTEQSRYNAMELANHFYESGLFQYAEPDLMIDDKINYVNTEPYFIMSGTNNCANDPYFGQQWALENTGQSGGKEGVDIKICGAWQLATGSNIIVAVVDEGIKLN